MTRLIERLIAAGMILAACGCTATSGTDSSSYAPKTVVDTDELSRARIHTELAAGYMELGNYGVSLQEAGEALKANPDYAPAYSVLGLVYMELRDDKAGVILLSHAQRERLEPPRDEEGSVRIGDVSKDAAEVTHERAERPGSAQSRVHG